MAFSPTSAHSSSDSEFDDVPIVAEINITPLTDIFLVLLIIFMVTSSALSQMGIQVQLPQSQNAASADTAPGILVTVNNQNQIFINGTAIPIENLEKAMKEMLDQSKDKTVVLEGDREAVLGTVVKVMDIGKKAGATKFAVATKNK